jgi:hypothetical protein
MNSLKSIGIAVIILGVICTLAILLYSTSWEEGVDLTLPIFYLWILVPYIVLLVSTFRIHRANSSSASRLAIFISSLAVVILSVLIYYNAVFVSLSSTSALIFLFVPGYALAAIAVIYFVSSFLLGLLTRQRKSL